MATTSFVFLDERAVLAVSGPDRRPFLQGLISNDVELLGQGRAGYAAFLTAQGKYLHDFLMAEAGEEIWFDAEAARLADLKRRLAIYRLRAKVSIDERPDLAVAAGFGEGAIEKLALPPRPGALRSFGGGLGFVDPRLCELGIRAILPLEGARRALSEAGFVETDFAAYDRLRLSLGVPDGSRDLAIEKSILLEAGFDELNGIDWRKGCYIGQELTARTKYRGLVKRRLMPVAIDGPAPPPGTIVTLEDRDVGEMRSSRDGRGLALLRIDPPLAGKRLKAAKATLVPEIPHWMRLETEDDASGSPR